MAYWCKNRLVVVGPKDSLARFKENTWWRNPLGNEPYTFHMEKLVPLVSETDKEAIREWGCDRICEATIKYLDSGTWCGVLELTFYSAWTPPEEFVENVSGLFPTLEFHHAFNREDSRGLNLRCYAPRMDCALGCCCGNEELGEYLQEYLNRHWPDPGADGLFDNPDSPKSNQSEGDPQ